MRAARSPSRPARVIDVKMADATVGLPFRAAHLIWGTSPLSREELEYMAEPLDEIFGALGLNWLRYVRPEYLKFAWGLSAAIASRVRGVLKRRKRHGSDDAREF